MWAEDDPTARFTKNFLKRCRVYQFHDTSLTANLRDYSALDQGRHLYADGGNLSAVLLDLRAQSPNDYASIVRTLQAVLPWFEDFELEPEGRKGVLLRWRMVGRGDYVFGPGQLSDGSLRIMAMVTLLLLPMDRQPDVIILDKPELGLRHELALIAVGQHAFGARLLPSWRRHGSAGALPSRVMNWRDKVYVDMFTAMERGPRSATKPSAWQNYFLSKYASRISVSREADSAMAD